MLEMPTLYFAYGANMNPESMKWRCPRAIPVGGFILRDWELQFYNHATIEPRKGAEVAGVIWDITVDCENSLDIFEGFPSYYTKRTWMQDDKLFFFYEMTNPKQGSPSRGYIDDIHQAYRHWQLPVQYLNQAVNVTTDKKEKNFV